MPSFDLITLPWIPVLKLDGTSEEVSLLCAIQEAPGIASITGNPLEAAVLHRLLLAIAHRVSAPKDGGEWLTVWQDRIALLDKMANYVQHHGNKFDLYGQERPFGQHPGLAGNARTAAEIVYERAHGNNPVFLDGSTVAEPRPIPSSLAVRSLLVTHAFAGSGTGSLNPLNANKKDTMFAGPLCARMMAVLEGQNLAETIVLNMATGRIAGQPAWERALCDVPRLTRPEGVCDLYTRTTRNIRLSPSRDGTSCIGALIVMGEGLRPEEGTNDDPLVPMYLAKDCKFKPLRLDPDKALWRNSQVLLVPEASESTRPLSSIELIRALVNRGALRDRAAMSLRTLGVAANAQGPVTELWRDETLPFALDLFASGNGYQAVVSAVQSAEKEANALYGQLKGFASRYVADGGGMPDTKDVSRLIEEISPGRNDFWMEIGPEGEQLPLAPPLDSVWPDRLTAARWRAFGMAINRLSPDARRMRAQFGRTGEARDQANSKVGKTG